MVSHSLMRLNKFISSSGICSRREADRHIEQGNVFINGKRAQVGDQVAPGDQVRVNGQLLDSPDADDFVFIAVNKPVGIVSTTESSERNNIVDFVKHGVRIFPIGRLDKDSQGLIFMTSNGDLVNKILRAGNNHEKEYLVTVNKPITDDFIAGLANGVPILGVTTKKCKVVKESTFEFSITLVQGLNRQIRRMCEHFNYEVKRLVRVRIMNVSLKGLPIGEWRDLTEKELSTLLKSVEHSSSEGKASSKAKSSKPAARRGGQGGAAAGNRAKSSTGRQGKPKAAGRGKPGASASTSSRNKKSNPGATTTKNKPGSRGQSKPGASTRGKPATASRGRPSPSANTRGKPARPSRRK